MIFFGVILVGNTLYIRLLYRTFKEILKLQGQHPFKLVFGFTTTCIMIVYENILELSTNKMRELGSK